MNKALEEFLGTAIRETHRTQVRIKQDEAGYKAEHKDFFFLPQFTDKGGKRLLTTTTAIEAIAKFGERWRKERKDRISQITCQTARHWATSAFCTTLCADDLTTGWTSGAVRERCAEIVNALDQKLKDRQNPRDHYFPCTIFPIPSALGSFSIGAVSFYPRDEWLDHIEEAATTENNGFGSEVIRNIRRGPRSDPSGATNEVAAGAIKYIGESTWVAGIRLQGSDTERSIEMAHGAARLAIDSIGLLFRKSVWEEMRGPGNESHYRLFGCITQTDNGSLTAPRLFEMSLGNGFWAEKEFAEKTVEYRNIVGRAISAVLDISPDDKFSLRQRWCDALFWFGEARRSSVEFMALVHYGVALDVLAGNGKSKGICELVSSLSGTSPESKPYYNYPKMTLKKSIDIIYGECRSQWTHGGQGALLRDLPISPYTVDVLVRRTLEQYIIKLDRYLAEDGAVDSCEKFLPWVKRNTQGDDRVLPPRPAGGYIS